MRKKPYVPPAIEIVELEPLMLAERGEMRLWRRRFRGPARGT
jgi:hypothetical protein